MSDVIQLLPDAVANQIAAGEVIQRPASVVKELIENAVDAGSTEITINIQNAGKTLIQISDNGKGMSETDARMAFERHATSKIKQANDLFALQTMGFRGEALASIAAVAQVELKTKPQNAELGTLLKIEGSQVVKQEAVNCAEGSNFLVKNLFFNIPARRKFLKSNQTENKHITTEFQRVALTHPDISFSFYNNNQENYILSASNLRQRIVNIFGKSINQKLLAINTQSSIISISGFIGKPEFAKKSSEQYFFVNNRFMRHPYFNKAVSLAYEGLVAQGETPIYFIYFSIAPQMIDVNIHPTKTEIKFEDEQAIFRIIRAAVKEALGKSGITPPIDFNTEGMIKMPSRKELENKPITIPTIHVNPNYNPFEEEKKTGKNTRYQPHKDFNEQANLKNWEKLYDEFETQSVIESEINTQQQIEDFEIKESQKTQSNTIQIKNRYIVTNVKSGMMLIDQKRAHERILFDRYLERIENMQTMSQQMLYPEKIELEINDYNLLNEIIGEVKTLGFNLQKNGKQGFIIKAVPSDLTDHSAVNLLEDLIQTYKTSEIDVKLSVREKVAESLAKVASIDYGKYLTISEMKDIIDSLFACSNPNYTPDGKMIVNIISIAEIESRF